MTTMSGIVEAISTKDVSTKFGVKPTFSFKVGGNWIKSGFKVLTLQITRWVITIIIFFFAISFLYYLGPSKKQKFRFISAGATLSTLLIILLAIGFNYYIENFSRYNTLYGSIGTLIIIMLWIYFVAMVILIGFDLNASISNLKKIKKV